MSKMTAAQMLLMTHLIELGYKDVESEYQFLPDRRFRFDLYIPELRIGIEANGGRWKRGHRSSRDTNKDNEKRNLAQLNGFRILEFTNEQILNGEAMQFLKEHL